MFDHNTDSPRRNKLLASSIFGGGRSTSTITTGSVAFSASSYSTHWNELWWWNQQAQQLAKAFQTYRLRDTSIGTGIGIHIIGTLSNLAMLQSIVALEIEKIGTNSKLFGHEHRYVLNSTCSASDIDCTTVADLAASVTNLPSEFQLLILRLWSKATVICLVVGIITGWLVIFSRFFAHRNFKFPNPTTGNSRLNSAGSTKSSFESDANYLLESDEVCMDCDGDEPPIDSFACSSSVSNSEKLSVNQPSVEHTSSINFITNSSVYRLFWRGTRFLGDNTTICILETIHFYFVMVPVTMYCVQVVMVSQYVTSLSIVVFNVPKHGLLPEGLVTGLSCTPLLLYMVFSSITFGHALLGLGIAMVANGVLCWKFELYESLPSLIINTTFALGMLAEYHRQCWTAFCVKQKLIQVNRDNAMLAEEVKAAELRHAIGNVVHDLKTPLTSFISGMEVVAMVGRELQCDLLQVANNIVKKKLDMIIDVADNVTSTNAFLIMTINRCVDYTKATFGITLQPKLEPFRIRDVINFVVNCSIHSNEMNDRVMEDVDCDDSDKDFILKPFPIDPIFSLHEGKKSRRRSHSSLFPPPSSIPIKYSDIDLQEGAVTIHSDRQWIQENLLCMVTNALRYSKDREAVAIEVAIVSYPKIPSENSCSPESSRAENAIHDCNIQLDNCKSEKELTIRVYDNGDMLDKHQCDHIFQEPVQSGRITGGVGVGLYTVALRVNALGGRYGVEKVSPTKETVNSSQQNYDSKAFDGKCFWFSIPFNPCSTNGGVVCGGTTQAFTKKLLSSIPTLPKLSISIPSNHFSGSTMWTPRSPDPVGLVNGSSYCPSLDSETTVCSLQRQSLIHILVVDDSPLVIKMTSLALKKQGYQVSVAENGQVAVDKYTKSLENLESLSSANPCTPKGYHAKSTIDIILMDFQMPIMDGVDAIHAIRSLENTHYQRMQIAKDESDISELHPIDNNSGTSLPECPSVFIIGFSAKSDDDQIQVAYENGMNAFLSKPFTLTAFQSILSQG